MSFYYLTEKVRRIYLEKEVKKEINEGRKGRRQWKRPIAKLIG